MTLAEETRQIAEFAWGSERVMLWVDDLFWLIYFRFVPFSYIDHPINVVRGPYPDDRAKHNILMRGVFQGHERYRGDGLCCSG
jgi:AGCS family alanine or glycine:cation symporter